MASRKKKLKLSFYPLDKETETYIIEHCNKFYIKHFRYPSVGEIKKLLKDKKNILLSENTIRKVRNKLPLITKYHPLGDLGKNRSHMFSMLRVSNLGWVEVDIMFITVHKVPYGQAFVAIDILSKRIFAHFVSGKDIPSMEEAISELLKAPGFTTTKCILSDNEPAIKSLGNNKRFPGVKFIQTDKKARTVERAIRTIKLLLSKYMYLKGENTFFFWKRYFQDVIDHLNQRQIPGKIPGETETVRPIDLNRRNVGKYISYMLFNNKHFFYSLHPIQNPANIDLYFKFKIGDLVYLAKKKDYDRKVRDKYWGENRSLSGHFSKYKKIEKVVYDNSFTITDRRLDYSKSGRIIKVYDIKQGDNYFYHVYERYLRNYPIQGPTYKNVASPK